MNDGAESGKSHFKAPKAATTQNPRSCVQNKGDYPVDWATPAPFPPIKALSGNLKGWLEVRTSHHCH